MEDSASRRSAFLFRSRERRGDQLSSSHSGGFEAPRRVNIEAIGERKPRLLHDNRGFLEMSRGQMSMCSGCSAVSRQVYLTQSTCVVRVRSSNYQTQTTGASSDALTCVVLLSGALIIIFFSPHLKRRNSIVQPACHRAQGGKNERSSGRDVAEKPATRCEITSTEHGFLFLLARREYELSPHSSVRPSTEHLNGAEQPNPGGSGSDKPAHQLQHSEGFRGGGMRTLALSEAW